MIISKLIPQSLELPDLRLLKLCPLISRKGTGILSAFCDAGILRRTVGVGRRCEVVGSTKGREAVLKVEDTGQDDERRLVLALGADCLDQLEVFFIQVAFSFGV